MQIGGSRTQTGFTKRGDPLFGGSRDPPSGPPFWGGPDPPFWGVGRVGKIPISGARKMVQAVRSAPFWCKTTRTARSARNWRKNATMPNRTLPPMRFSYKASVGRGGAIAASTNLELVECQSCSLRNLCKRCSGFPGLSPLEVNVHPRKCVSQHRRRAMQTTKLCQRMRYLPTTL